MNKKGKTSSPPQDLDLEKAPIEEVKKKLQASSEGLNKDEIKKRLDKYGFNEIVEEKINPFFKFLSYFWGPIPWMIEAAVILSAVVGNWDDFGIILTLLIVNGVVGFVEEYQAGNAIEALKKALALKAKVKREGVWRTVPARELVPGDYIRIRLGDIVPADARLLKGDPIEIDQSALTGESLPVTHKEHDAVFSGSIVKKGEIDALVYATGSNTYFGKTAGLVEKEQSISHFQIAVLNIGRYLIYIAIALVMLIIIVAFLRGDPFLETVAFALVLTVAAIPVAMPTILSVTMAVGARILAGKKALVSRLVSIEELAGADVLCSDKTGTLTKNSLELGEIFCLKETSPEEIVELASLASREEDQDPIDLAILKKYKEQKHKKDFKTINFIPFDPVNKRTEATIVFKDGKPFKVSKGAPQVILALIKDQQDISKQINDQIDNFAQRGYRSLAVARTDTEGAWQFLGILPLYDPPRDDSKKIISTAKAMGLTIKMLTGDQVSIAKEISRRVGLGTNILDASLLESVQEKEKSKLAKSILQADGFAQVYPEHKYRIVEALQTENHIVGMCGDGVNDAPALKKADCGIAVSGATDAARMAADIVLLDSGLSVIIGAIKESRKIFQRMNSYVIYRIAETIRVLLFMTLSILIFNFYPVTAIMIVLLALLNDGAILSIAFDNVIYSKKPSAWNMKRVLVISTTLGVCGVIATFGLFFLLKNVFHLDRNTIQTCMYLKLSVAGHMTIFVTRTRKAFWSFWPAKALIFAVLGTQILATFIAVYGFFMTPIGWLWALLIWGYAFAWFLFNDRIKILLYYLAVKSAFLEGKRW